MKYLLTIVFTLIFLQSYALDFSTQFLRGTWHTCFISSQQKAPYIPVNLHAIYCDCLIDKGRLHFGSEAMYKSYDNKTEMWIKLANDCNYELNANRNDRARSRL